jgi:hypothetical protein
MRLILLLVVVLAACTAQESGEPTADTTRAPTPDDSVAPSPRPTRSVDASPTGGDTATLRGTLGVEDVEGGCAYVRDDDGTRWEVVYPAGWRIRVNPLELSDPDGEVVARASATITVRGREARDSASICQVGPIFEATEVVSVDAR